MVTARWSRQCARRPIDSRITRITHGTRNAAAKRPRDSATMPVPNTGTAMRMKMYCSDHRVASSSHRAAADRESRLEVHALQRVCRIARTRAGAYGRDLRDLLHLLRREPHLERVEVLVHALAALRAGNRHDVLALPEEPGEDELRRRAL